jgi:hypothetical protein
MIGHRITGLPVVNAASDVVRIVTKAICCGVPGSGAATEGNSLRQGIFSGRRRNL